MNLNKANLFFILFCFILINFQYFFSILFINQFNLPDGMLHLMLFDKQISSYHPQNLYIYFKNFDLYNIFFLKNFIASIFPSLDDQCFINWSHHDYITDSCHNKYFISKDWHGFFGFDIQLYNYSIFVQLGLNEISLFIYLLFLNLFIFTLICKYKDKKFVFCVIVYLYFPSVINNISYISPNIFSSYLQIFLFYLFINKKYLIYFLLSFFIVFLDKSILPNLMIILVFYFYLFLANLKYEINTYVYLMIYLCLIFLILIFIKHSLFIGNLLQYISPQLSQNYAYLSIGDQNFFKSIIIIYLSLYYIGGSMSHLAFLLEHIIFFIMSLFIFLTIFKYIIKNKLYNFEINLLYFLIGNFVVFYMLILFPNLNQGRYYFFILLAFIYFYNHYLKDNLIFLYYILPIFFVLNNLKLVKFINTGFL